MDEIFAKPAIPFSIDFSSLNAKALYEAKEIEKETSEPWGKTLKIYLIELANEDN